MCEHPEFIFSEKFVQSPQIQDGAKTVSPHVWGPENTWSKSRSDSDQKALYILLSFLTVSVFPPVDYKQTVPVLGNVLCPEKEVESKQTEACSPVILFSAPTLKL